MKCCQYRIFILHCFTYQQIEGYTPKHCTWAPTLEHPLELIYAHCSTCSSQPSHWRSITLTTPWLPVGWAGPAIIWADVCLNGIESKVIHCVLFILLKMSHIKFNVYEFIIFNKVVRGLIKIYVDNDAVHHMFFIEVITNTIIYASRLFINMWSYIQVDKTLFLLSDLKNNMVFTRSLYRVLDICIVHFILHFQKLYNTWHVVCSEMFEIIV